MANFVTGVTVVTTAHEGEIHAMTANSFTSISLEPPLVMIAVMKGGNFAEHALASGSWAISILSTDQRDAAAHFANGKRDRATQFDGQPHVLGEKSGAPLLIDALAWLECRTSKVVEAGDHLLMVGEVTSASVCGQQDPAPLTYFRRAFR